jgi:hypothetical protein
MGFRTEPLRFAKRGRGGGRHRETLLSIYTLEQRLVGAS